LDEPEIEQKRVAVKGKKKLPKSEKKVDIESDKTELEVMEKMVVFEANTEPKTIVEPNSAESMIVAITGPKTELTAMKEPISFEINTE